MAVPACAAVSLFPSLLPAGPGLAAGAMIWMIFADLFPDSLDVVEPSQAATLAAIACGSMLAFQRVFLR